MADQEPVEQSGEPPAVEERPDWLPENFKEPTALVNSYQESQRKISEQGQELSRLREEIDGMAELVAQSQQQPLQQDPNQHPLVQQYQNAYDSGDAASMLAIQAQLTQAVFQETMQAQQPQNGQNDDSMLAVYGDMAERSLRQTYGDTMYQELSGRAAELLSTGQVPVTDPSTLGGVQSAMDTAFRHAASERLFSQQQEQAATAEQAEADRQRKLAAQTVQGQGTRPAPPDQQQQVWDELVAAGQNKFRAG